MLRVVFGIVAVLLAAPKPKPAPLAPPDEHVSYWIRTLESHPIPLVRKNAARTLGTMKDQNGLQVLLKALSDPDGGVRAESARALGYLGNENAIPALEKSGSKDTDARVRRNSKDAVERIKTFQEFMKKKQEKEKKAAGDTP